ncbi:peptide-methionine (R)-S-oxide reductase MsrB [Formicincola oecophyllae]|uniref:peptide-methionine (R)-S-oxide reductase n=1 Tax=Formicincola oecophyllae TaxID=2558361 RepID=A0A4Y6U9J1_9PROT|nr:peptide-methionine (R)-S-oxide reductase MsrB [Formicincola oecophyllae]QDH13117.1 peptide-methionine (R)-S-oxide reductase MsrB [Formicincola oecophyllae]
MNNRSPASAPSPSLKTASDPFMAAARRAVLEGATEPPFSSPLNQEGRAGLYSCAGCGAPLYKSSAKFPTSCGWPGFTQGTEGAIATRADHSHNMTRTEIHCARCGGHLGHVFDDGPTAQEHPEGTTMRHCVNGLALDFTPSGA